MKDECLLVRKKSKLQKNKKEWSGDAWKRTAIDAVSKLTLSYFLGGRDADSSSLYMNDVASRLSKEANILKMVTEHI
ncbi:MAG: hypothetical protein ACO1G9_13585 [Bacteroidota bacterium]